MDEQTMDNIVLNHQPVDYLERIGKSYGGQAGLGEAGLHDESNLPKVVYVPVMVSSEGSAKQVGMYIIKLDDGMKPILVSYSGYDKDSGIPTSNGNKWIKLDAMLSPNGVTRQDRYTDVDFPGFNIAGPEYRLNMTGDELMNYFSTIMENTPPGFPEQLYVPDENETEQVVNQEGINGMKVIDDLFLGNEHDYRNLPPDLALQFQKANLSEMKMGRKGHGSGY